MNTSEIISIMQKLANEDLALEWDNTGFILGDDKSSVKTILLALDIDDNVINEAIGYGVQLIITHHPIIFKGVKNITTKTTPGKWMLKLIKNNISVYTSHTNLDIIQGGVNDSLFDALQLVNKSPLKDLENGNAMGRVGDTVKTYTLQEFANFVGQKLNTNLVRYVGNADEQINRVALCGGAASDLGFFKAAVQRGAHVFVTGDVRYHEAQRAQGIGLNLIDATHFATENVVLKDLKKYLQSQVNDSITIHLSQADLQPFKSV